MISCELLDGNARIDSNPDTVHARGALPESTRGFPHELHMLHDAVFALSRERQNRLQYRHGAFTRDRSKSPVCQILTKYDCTKLGQIFLRGVGRKNPRASSRSPSLFMFCLFHLHPSSSRRLVSKVTPPRRPRRGIVSFSFALPESTRGFALSVSIRGCIYERQERSPVCQGPDNDTV